MATKQHGGPKDEQRDKQRSDVGGDEQRPRDLPSKDSKNPPGMGEDEDEITSLKRNGLETWQLTQTGPAYVCRPVGIEGDRM